MPLISVIIVTHNSQQVLSGCLSAIRKQSIPSEVILIDSGSQETAYIDQQAVGTDIKVFKTENVGFSRANNLGFQQVKSETDYILFLNPDAFLGATALADAVSLMAQQKNSTIGCLTGRLVSYDCELGKPTGCIDSTGIFRKWFGRWYDRGHGLKDMGQYRDAQDVPAACGAFMFCRKRTLDQVALHDGVIFDPDFFLYKEDIELSLRIRKALWRIVYFPDIIIYHSRGWKTRHKVPYSLRLTAAKSDILLYRKHPSPYLLWALLKYFLVRYLKA